MVQNTLCHVNQSLIVDLVFIYSCLFNDLVIFRINCFSTFYKKNKSTLTIWVKKCFYLDLKIFKSFLKNNFNIFILKNVNLLILFYNYLICKVSNTFYNYNRCLQYFSQYFSLRLTFHKVKKNWQLETIQNVFLESFSILFFILYNFKFSFCSQISGLNNLAFITLELEKKKRIKKFLLSTKYYKSSKSLKIKNNKPLIINKFLII